MEHTDRVFIRTLGDFSISVNGVCHDKLASRSKKGISLLIFLILKDGAAVSNRRIIRELWDAKWGVNPENALKTMVSRVRGMLNELSPTLGDCLKSERGAYRFIENEYVTSDVGEISKICARLSGGNVSESEEKALSRRVIELYKGDLYDTDHIKSLSQESGRLRKMYLDAVYAYVGKLNENEEFNEAKAVCEKALETDELDEQLRIELMRALVGLNRTEDAKKEYRLATRMNRRYLDAEPGEELKDCYEELIRAGSRLSFNLDVIRNELMRLDRERKGPLFCDYTAFLEIYNIQLRNLERLGSTMFLGVIMISGAKKELSDVSRESCMAGLTEILKNNLRKGDIVTRFAPEVFAMLLPTVNYSTGNVVMTRLRDLFYGEYSPDSVIMHTRIAPLGGQDMLIK